jgi:xylulokinase
LAANLKTAITVPVIDEGAAYGAAMLAALGAGVPLSEIKSWAKAGPATEPTGSDAERYEALYGQFRALYRDLKDRFRAVAALGRTGSSPGGV